MSEAADQDDHPAVRTQAHARLVADGRLGVPEVHDGGSGPPGRPGIGMGRDQFHDVGSRVKAAVTHNTRWADQDVFELSLAQDGMTGLPRVVEMGLYDGGRLGYVGVEGADHNPNAVELEAVFYQEAASSPAIARHLFTPVDGAASIVVGQGCSSLTIRMSDAALDAMAAPMAEIFTGLQIEEPGSIHVLRREGIGLAHASIEVPKLERVALEGMDGWRLSLTTDVQRRIMEEAAEHPKTETGGVLIGWSSAIARQIVVTDLIPAPADSKRSRTKFELGVDGVSEKLAEIHARSGELLRCVGTWHSHLGSAAPSLTDKTSAALVGAGYVQPMAFLILGTDGWRGVSFAARLIDTLPEEKG